MQVHVQQVIKRLHDCRVWLDANDGPLQSVPAYPQLKSQLSAQENNIVTLSQSQQTQSGGASQQVVLKNQLLEAVKHDNESIARGARAIAISRPGFDVPFVLVNSHGEEAIMGTARTFLGLLGDAATKKAFTDMGMPADFVSDLQSDIERFESFSDGKDAATQARIAALRDLNDAITAASGTVDQIDAQIHFVFADAPNVIAGWNEAKRLGNARAHRASSAI